MRIFLEQDTPYMYRTAASCTGRHAQGNFSAVDVENPDFDQFPISERIGDDVVLAPGDFVFIPAKCWHYVRSLTASISMNFWF